MAWLFCLVLVLADLYLGEAAFSPPVPKVVDTAQIEGCPYKDVTHRLLSDGTRLYFQERLRGAESVAPQFANAPLWYGCPREAKLAIPLGPRVLGL